MYQTISVPLCSATLSEYCGWSGFRQELCELQCGGIEAIWSGKPLPADVLEGLVIGYHLTFYPDWLDFYREDTKGLERKFGSLDAVRQFYGGFGRECLLAKYREDLSRAERLRAKYVVFHVSDVSVEEGYTYRWLHSNRGVIEASGELINTLLEGRDWPFEFLVENQWWPGFTFTEPAETARLLDAIHHAWCEPCIATVVRRIAPCYLTHELSAPGRTLRAEWVRRQTDALRKGGVQNA
ncbi:MAG: hypothetical protein ABT00_17705 [Bordetella sp. SCN 68-11]|mgnify:CR=1 FL=1|nr:MAG: hypothetical protein ABT00_17705 [Bordetella sp. SCN 68-11]